MRLVFATSVLVCVSQIALSCAKKNEKDTVTEITEPFIKKADLDVPSELVTKSKSSVEEDMQSASEVDTLYANAPKSNSEGESTSTCFDDPIKNIKVVAKSEKLTFGGKVDISDCLKTSFSKDSSDMFKITQVSGTLEVFSETSCEGVDLSSSDGKTFSEISSDGKFEKICASAAGGRTLLNSRVIFNVTLEAQGQNISLSKQISFAAVDAEASGCVLTNAETTLTRPACVHLEAVKNLADSSQPDSVGKTEFKKYVMTNIVENKEGSPLFFNSGTIDVTLSNWTGKITYSGAATAPQFSMTNGTDTITGTLSTTAGSELYGSEAVFGSTSKLSIENVASAVKREVYKRAEEAFLAK